MVVILQVSTTKVYRWKTLIHYYEYGQKSMIWKTPNFQNGKQTTKVRRWQTQIHDALECWSTHNNVKILGRILVIHWLYNGDTICSPITKIHQPLLANSLGEWWNCQADRECSDMAIVHSKISALFKFISNEPFKIQIWQFFRKIFHWSIDEGFWKIQLQIFYQATW